LNILRGVCLKMTVKISFGFIYSYNIENKIDASENGKKYT